MSDDDAVVPVTEALMWQRDYTLRTGSTTAALILQTVIDRLDDLPLVPRMTRFGSMPGLRIMAAVHRLAIDRRAPGVALHLPTLGGTAPRAKGDAGFSDAVVHALAAHPEVLSDYLARIPQTNEVSRAPLLRAALSRLGVQTPIALVEFGCSAGLNLLADQLPGNPAWESGPLPPIASRQGCDLRPVDASTAEGRALLSSYIWVDDVDRWSRLQAALEVHSRKPVPLVASDAETYLRGLGLTPGVCTVVWHSAMWVYLDVEQRHRTTSALEELARDASPRAPLVEISWELGDHRRHTQFELAMRRWDGAGEGGAPVVLARGLSHGNEVSFV